MNNILKKVIIDTNINIKYTFELPNDMRSITDISNVAGNRFVREELIQSGRNYIQTQYKTMKLTGSNDKSNIVLA